ncbi:MAG: penicillin-binding transpeptidase domain-containing protein, partial [Oscillospiraceae bacterium]
IFANNGIYIEPTFVEGIVDENNFTIKNSYYHPQQRKVYSEDTSKTISIMLENVVNNGLGKSAKPIKTSAAGKTGTAQTGREDDNGNELMNAWFVGYFPVTKPQYTIAVLLDDGTHSSEDACKIFAKTVNTINLLLQ